MSLLETKEYLRVSKASSHLDSTIELAIWSATSMVEQDSDRVLITQEFEFSHERFPAAGEKIALKHKPIQAITKIQYLDPDGSDQQVPAGDYALDLATREIYLTYGAAWPEALVYQRSVRVTYTAGYGADGASVPHYLRSMILARCDIEFYGSTPQKEECYKNLLQRVIPTSYIQGPIE